MATVLAKSRIGDSFIRLRLAAPDLEDFARSGLHYRLLLPPARRDPKWPVIGANGRTLWPEGEDALHTPAYTIRAIDAERGHFDTDILIHGRGPTCAWAETVEEGAIVGLSGPGGGWLPEGLKLTLLGDETALPAIARILESCAPDTVGEALIQVDGEGDIQPLAAPEGITVTWLLRGRDPELSDALEALTLPEGESAIEAALVGHEQLDKAVEVHPVARHHQPARRQQRFDQRRDEAGEIVVLGPVVPAEVRVDEARHRAEAAQGGGQCLGHVAEDLHCLGRRGIRVRGNRTLEDVDIAPPDAFEHVVIGAAIAEAEFEHRPLHRGGRFDRGIETGTLRDHPVDEKIKTAHVRLPCCTRPRRRDAPTHAKTAAKSVVRLLPRRNVLMQLGFDETRTGREGDKKT